MARKMHEKRPEEDNRYHDTWKLLKKYRDVTWSLEVSVRQVKRITIKSYRSTFC